MKPFGVRLAAGAVTILLGAIMAGQAQKNRQNDSDAAWSAASSATGEPPKPIAALDSDAWLADSPPPALTGSPTSASGPASANRPALANDPAPAKTTFSNAGAVKLVQHTEAAEDLPTTPPSANISTFEIPEMSLPTFSEPADAVAVGQKPENADDMAVLQTMELPTLPNGVKHGGGENGGHGNGSGENFGDEIFSDQNSGAEASLALPTMPAPSADSPPVTPSVTVGQPSMATTQSNQLAGANAESFGGQPGNLLRDGSSNDLRPGLQGTPALSEHQRGEQQGTAQESQLRTIALPEQPESGAAPLQANNPRNAGNTFAPSGNGNDQTLQPNMRIVGGPAADESYQRQTFQSPHGATQGEIQAANNAYQPGYNQPASNYGPSVPSGQYLPAGPGGSTGQYPGTQPIAPPLQNGPAARIASLPNPNSGGFRPQSFEQPTAAAQINVDPSATMAAPGDRRFDGVQSPSIVIHKRAPAEVKVGKPASFVIHVQNVGTVEAMDVRVHDRVPAGMRLVDASPSPVQQGEVLMWQLGSMRAGDERTVTLQLVPLEEGELGSVARVTFEAVASVRTISTRPELKIVQQAREQVLIGQQLEIDLEISNPGTGEATGVVLQEDVPEGLEHPKGRQLDNVIGTLQPGETRRQVLRLRAVTPGVIQNTIHLRGDDGLESSHTVAIEVVSPQLQMQLTGPSRRFLERQATYQLDIANTGTADATNVEIACYLDRGFTFVSTDLEGQYDPSRHAVFWSLANLPAGVTGDVPLTLLPVQEGERAIRMEARADLGIIAKNERTVTVDSLAELTFQITDSADPVEVGGETTYEIRLTNSGSRNDSNVRVQLELPPGLELLSSDADAETNGQGLIAFAPRRELAAGGEMVYRVKARGVTPGRHLVKAVVLSDQSTVPVTKEESTLVYSDR